MTRLLLVIAITMSIPAQAVMGQTVVAENVSPVFPVPAAEGLFRTASAEPLGRGGFNVRFLSEAYKISVADVGEGTSFTGQLGVGFGLSNSLDITASVPVMFDIAGGLTKYGSGDLTASLKLGFPGKFPAPVYGGFEVAATFPLGFKGNQPLRVRPFSREEREVATRILFDVNREAVGLRANIGYIVQSGTRNTGPMLAAGLEVGRGQIFTVTAEYLQEPGTAGEPSRRAIFGARMNLWWLQLEAGVEQGFSPDLPDFSGMAGVRLQKSFGNKIGKSFGGRVRRVPVKKNVEGSIRVAVVNLTGFEHQGAGEGVAQRIKTALTRYGHIRVVSVGEGTAFLDPDAAISLARDSGADIIITGRLLKYEMKRDSRPNLPLVVGFPETRAEVAADLRIVDTRRDGDIFSANLSGSGRQGRGVRMFPTSGDDRTSYLSVLERDRVWDEAVDQMVAKLMRELTLNFDWFPG